MILNNTPNIYINAVADNDPIISNDGFTHVWKGRNNRPVIVTDKAVIKDTKVEGIDSFNLLVDKSLKTIKQTAISAINE